MSDIEIIDIENDPSLTNMLTLDSDEDEDIICLDTVFKPVQKDHNSEQNEETVLHPTTKSEIPSSETQETKLESESAESKTTKYFSTDEESIDDNLAAVPTPDYLFQPNKLNIQEANPAELIVSYETYKQNNTQVELQASLLSSSEIKEKRSDDVQQLGLPNISNSSSNDEPPTKKMKVQKLIRASHDKRQSLHVDNIGMVNPKACTYPKPTGTTFIDLIVIILKNCKCLLFGEIWDYIAGLFPYFEYNFTIQQGVIKIRRVIQKAPTFFLKTTSGVGLIKQMKQLLIMLNPLTKKEQDLVTTNLLAKRKAIMKSMYVPECFDPLMAGTASLPSIKLFHLRKRCSTSILEQPSSSSVAATATTSNVSHEEVPTTQHEKPNAVDASSPKSNSSTDTVVFDPKIVNCRSMNQDELFDSEMFRPDCNVDEETCGSSDKEMQSVTGMKDLSTLLLSQIENCGSVNSMQTLGTNNAFANTVWTADEEALQLGKGSPSVDPLAVETKSSANASSSFSFPEVDRCIPMWKKVFPWICWKPWLRKIFCVMCNDITIPQHSSENAIVGIVSPDDIFKVSKHLRGHSEKTSHKMAVVLQNKSIITTIYFLINSHFSEFNSTEEILTVLKDLSGKSSIVSLDILKTTLAMIGEYLEDKVVTAFRSAKRFSVITDPCAGLLIVRWLNAKCEPEEHILSSFSSTNNKNPAEYLSSLGVNMKQMIAFVTNARCGECTRCKLTKSPLYRNLTPLRFPQLDRYLVFLWRRKLLKPFYSLGSTLCKLWMGFPHKFIAIGKIVSLDKLTKFASNPDAFIDIFQHFEKFKEIAASIYSLNGNLEALGLQKIDISKYLWMLDLFPILTSINIHLMEIRVVSPFGKDSDNLCRHVEKLQLFCENIKEDINTKKIETPVNVTDIDDLFSVVQMTAKEFQQQIYHKGKSVELAYARMTCVENLEDINKNAALQNSFTVLFTAFKSHYSYCEITFKKSLASFLKAHRQFQRKSPQLVLEFLIANSEIAKDYAPVMAFYKVMALFPFQPTKLERCLYEIKVYDYLFYRSAWAGIGPNVKDYLLTIISELNSGKQLLSEKDMRDWWRKKIQNR